MVWRNLSHLLLGVTLSISLLNTACSSDSDPSVEANAAAPALPVQLLKLQSEIVRDSSEFVGNLEAVKIVQIRPEIQGRIEKILVQAGDRVEADTVDELNKRDKFAFSVHEISSHLSQLIRS